MSDWPDHIIDLPPLRKAALMAEDPDRYYAQCRAEEKQRAEAIAVERKAAADYQRRRHTLKWRAAWHELRCTECRVSWKSWTRRLMGDRRGYNPRQFG